MSRLGDFDNDGDLDLFVANLAHPRFIEFSDISQLLKNDGLTYKVIESDTPGSGSLQT